MSNAAPTRDAGAVQSVDRAVTALEHLARQGESGVTELAEVIGVHKSTASRLLGVLQVRGLVESTGERGRYRLGFGILRLAGSMSARLDLAGQGRAICDELAERSGETVNIAVRQADDAVNVHQSHGGRAISVDNWVGRPTPLHATSSGKVLLAWGSRPLPAELTRYTEATVTDPSALADQLDTARRDGYAVTAGEYEVGLNAVAAPVFGPDHRLLGAVSVSGPAYRLTPDRFVEIAGPTVAAARALSERMGHF